LGNFYANFLIADAKSEDVLSAAKELRRRAFIFGIGRDVVLCDSRCDMQDVPEIEGLGAELSGRLGSFVLGSMNHDDDHLLLWLFRKEGIKRYESFVDGPSFAWALSGVRGGRGRFPLLAAALTWPIVIFQLARHRAVASAGGFPTIIAGAGYGYLSKGELPLGVPPEQILEA
jgi:hypothetical protein